ncbi:hypothetical protein PSH03_004668 [Micromonospora sp. PSH03]|uniref:hypothetical protein n=1 Tax=Micromonospora salmantinae TaxID=2911211 RepID=UPI001EE7AC75|nr:hypothetical protein [Micromonospora salmantinae]MCG5458905.1 hypothetical protein [Micromonospora salmantinae]
MKINSSTEAAMRAMIHAAVQRDFPKLDERLRTLNDDNTAAATVELALALVGFLMVDIHKGRPSDDQISAVAEEVAEAESWAQPTRREVADFLMRLMRGEPFATAVPTENAIILAFVVAANLLSSCRRDDEKWWDYLDRMEAAMEAAR